MKKRYFVYSLIHNEFVYCMNDFLVQNKLENVKFFNKIDIKNRLIKKDNSNLLNNIVNYQNYYCNALITNKNTKIYNTNNDYFCFKRPYLDGFNFDGYCKKSTLTNFEFI